MGLACPAPPSLQPSLLLSLLHLQAEHLLLLRLLLATAPPPLRLLLQFLQYPVLLLLQPLLLLVQPLLPLRLLLLPLLGRGWWELLLLLLPLLIQVLPPPLPVTSRGQRALKSPLAA